MVEYICLFGYAAWDVLTGSVSCVGYCKLNFSCIYQNSRISVWRGSSCTSLPICTVLPVRMSVA